MKFDVKSMLIAVIVAIISESISIIMAISLLVSASKIGFAEAISVGNILGIVILGLAIPAVSIIIGFFFTTKAMFKE